MALILLALIDASLTDRPVVPVAELALRADCTEKTAKQRLDLLESTGRAVCSEAGCRLATKED